MTLTGVLGAGCWVLGAGCWVLGAGGILWAGVANAFPQVSPAPGVDIRCSLEYARPAGRALHLEVFSPVVYAPSTGVLLVHGEGWSSGSCDHQHLMTTYQARRGFIAVTVEYRRSPEARYPAAVQTVQTALR